MFRIIREFFGPRMPQPQPEKRLEKTVVYVRVKADGQSTAKNPVDTVPASPFSVLPLIPIAPGAVQPTKRSREFAREKSRKSGSVTLLASLKVFSSRQVKLLRHFGCRTDRDLMRLTPKLLEKRLADFAASQNDHPDSPLDPPIDRIRSLVRRGRWAIRFARQFNDMTPRESLLLRAVHRANRQALTQDSAGMIRRDLQRLALSSRGQRILTLDEIPEVDRVKSWIAQSRDSKNETANGAALAYRSRASALQEDSQPNVPAMPR